MPEAAGSRNVLVVDQEGKIVAKALESNADFTSSRFNLLRETFRTHEPSEAVEIELPEQEWHKRYYASRIDDKTMAVIEQSPDELTELIAATGSTKSVLRNISIGQHGYVIAISAKDYLVTYHPDENLVGADAIDAGLDVARARGRHVLQHHARWHRAVLRRDAHRRYVLPLLGARGRHGAIGCCDRLRHPVRVSPTWST